MGKATVGAPRQAPPFQLGLAVFVLSDVVGAVVSGRCGLYTAHPRCPPWAGPLSTASWLPRLGLRGGEHSPGRSPANLPPRFAAFPRLPAEAQAAPCWTRTGEAGPGLPGAAVLRAGARRGRRAAHPARTQRPGVGAALGAFLFVPHSGDHQGLAAGASVTVSRDARMWLQVQSALASPRIEREAGGSG